MICEILEITNGTTPRMDGPTVPPETCDFCGNLLDICPCDEPIGFITDFGRTTANEMPLIRQAHRQAAWNGNGSTCNVLEGILPALKDALRGICEACGEDETDCECGTAEAELEDAAAELQQGGSLEAFLATFRRLNGPRN